MNYKMICRFLGLMLAVGAIFLLPALAISLCCARWAAYHFIIHTHTPERM